MAGSSLRDRFEVRLASERRVNLLLLVLAN